MLQQCTNAMLGELYGHYEQAEHNKRRENQRVSPFLMKLPRSGAPPPLGGPQEVGDLGKPQQSALGVCKHGISNAPEGPRKALRAKWGASEPLCRCPSPLQLRLVGDSSINLALSQKLSLTEGHLQGGVCKCRYDCTHAYSVHWAWLLCTCVHVARPYLS